MFQVGQVLRNTYRIERQIGQGGMGTVYEAAHLRLARRFAVKALYPDVKDNAEALERFRREAIFTSALGHRHIVEIVDFAHTDEGIPYLVMEMLQGESLAELIKRRQKLSLKRTTAIFRQTAQALQAAHNKGIVHRDMKPSNIFLCQQENQDTFVKVLDFGVSKMLGMRSSLTQSNHLLGTPFYMSPEQADEVVHQIDQRSDIYAMGTILFEMLCGTLPFVGSSIPTVLYKIVHHEVPSLQALAPEIPAALDQVIQRAMHKQPQARYSSMKEFWHAFAAALNLEASELEPRSEQDLSRETNISHLPTGEMLDDTLPLLTSPDEEGQTTPPLDISLEVNTGVAARSEGTAPSKEAAVAEGADLPGRATWPRNTGGTKPSLHYPVGRLTLIGLLVLGGFSLVYFIAVRPQVKNMTPPQTVPPQKKTLAVLPPRLPALGPGDPDGRPRADLATPRAILSRRRALWLSSDPPGAKVTLGETSLGLTPLEKVEIPTQTITLLLQKRGWQKIPLAITAGEEDLHLTSVKLSPNPTVSPRASRTARLTTPPDPAALSINVSPPANVVLNGQALGQAPLVKTGLLPGKYIIELSRPGYVPKTSRITLHPGKTETLSLTLEREP